MTNDRDVKADTIRLGEDPERFFREIEIEFLIHELKDPLAIIETGLRSLLERQDKIGPLTPRQEKTLQRTLRSSQKARQMLNGLLEIGRSEEGCFSFCGFSPTESVRCGRCGAPAISLSKKLCEGCLQELNSEIARSRSKIQLPGKKDVELGTAMSVRRWLDEQKDNQGER